MYGVYRDDDEWTEEYGEGERCPKCGAPDWHPDPSGPNGETWWVCESCGYEIDHHGKLVEIPIIKPAPQQNSRVRAATVMEVPNSIKDWVENILMHYEGTQLQKGERPRFYIIGESSMSVRFKVDYFNFLRAINLFPEEFELYAADVHSEDVSFQFKLYSGSEEAGF